MNTIENVAVVGLGYIGLPTAAILAANDVHVIGVDVNQGTVDAVNRGEVPFVEPDLASYVAGAVSQKRLSASMETPAAQAYIVAVPTPFNPDHTADVTYIKAAARAIAPKLVGDELVILESTSPPGTTQLLGDYLISLRPDLSLDGTEGKAAIHVAHCPERVLPGRIMIELVTNDRIVGGLTPKAAELARALYAVFCQGEILVTDAATAEMAKLVENSYRDVNIAFANELSVISDKLGINVWELIKLANHHPRVNILQPGPGVGGHCIAVDPWFIVAAARDEAQLIRQARETNDAKPDWVVKKVLESVGDKPSPKVAVLGLAFKANIDDLRESPSVAIVEKLSAKMDGAELLVVEPHVESLPRQLSGLANVTLSDFETSIAAADAVVLLVDHDDFKEIDRAVLDGKAVIDTRGIWQ